MCWHYLWVTYLTPLTPLVAALLAFVLGRYVYFRQKEYELIAVRYLNEGVDAVSENIDRSLSLFRYNWWQATVLLKHFRELGKDMRPELYGNIFITPGPDIFELWRDYRLNDLLGVGVVFRARQQLDVFTRSSYAFFQDDLATVIRLAVAGGKTLEVTATPQEVTNKYLKELERLDEESYLYYDLLGQLQALGTILQTERFSFRQLARLRERQEVKDIVAQLEAKFGKDPTPKAEET